MTARTDDVHRPAALVTEDYEYVLSYDQHPEDGDRRQLQAYLAETGRHFAENESAGGCFHCGARIRYAAVLLHKPTGELVKVGETCLENRFDLASADFHRLRKAAQLDREAQRIKRRRAVWFAIDQDRQVAFEWASYMLTQGEYGFQGMRATFVHNVNRYGDTSAKFVRAIMRDMVRTERYEERRAVIEAERAREREQAQPVPNEKGVTITGEVVSVKWQENDDYGDRHVMTVKDDRGFLVWGSVPNVLEATQWYDEKGMYQYTRGVEKGDRITFVANVQPSERDDKFGFFKRPRKAEFTDDEKRSD